MSVNDWRNVVKISGRTFKATEGHSRPDIGIVGNDVSPT